MAGIIRAQFEDRFMEHFAGTIVRDAQTAIVELIANAWDAYATRVKIHWPDDQPYFSIEDNGIGLTAAEFKDIWKRLSYDRIERFGTFVHAPASLGPRKPRRVFGRNGKGRLAGFYFGESYHVETWRDGEANTFRVSKDKPLKIEPLGTAPKNKHGLKIIVDPTRRLEISAQMVRQVIGNRFLFDPEFQIVVNGTPVTFRDIPENRVSEHKLVFENGDEIRAIVVDSALPHETTKTHGIAWWINGRSVGNISWIWPPAESLLDGRSSEAKRYSIVLRADCMFDAVRADWSGFDTQSEKWIEYSPQVHDFVSEILGGLVQKERRSTLDRAVAASRRELEQLSPNDRDKWARTLDTLMEKCPTLSETEITQVMNILAKMETTESQYSLLSKLEQMAPSDIDGANEIFERWSVTAAKFVLDEIDTRLKLISEIDRLTRDPKTDEVHDLQPLFEKGLWVFGPEFESIEYTSNQTISSVVKKFVGGNATASKIRPDFIVLPDASLGFYALPSFGDDHAEAGIASLVVVELKKPGIPIGTTEKDQAWKYVKALLDTGVIQTATKVSCFVLGMSIAPHEGDRETRGKNTTITAMLYDTFVKRGNSRLFRLREKIAASEIGERATPKENEVDRAMKYTLKV